MPSLLETLNALLADNRVVASLAVRVGGTEDETAAAVGPSLARIIDGLAALASDDFGVESVLRLVDHHGDPAVGSTAPSGTSSGTMSRSESGNVILDRVFGAERGLVVIGLASALGLAPSLVGRLLPLLAPLVTAELSRRQVDESLDVAALIGHLVWDQRAIAQAGVLDGTTFDSSTITSTPAPAPTSTPAPAETASAEADVEVDVEVGDAPAREVDRSGRRQPASSVAERATVLHQSTGAGPARLPDGGLMELPTVGLDDDRSDESPSGNLATLEEADGQCLDADTTDVVATVETATDDRVDEPVGRTGGPSDDAPAEPDPAPVVEHADAPDTADDRANTDGTDTTDGAEATDGAENTDGTEHPGATLTGPAGASGAAALAWLGWAVGAVVLVLLLAWVLSTCGAATEDAERATVINLGSTDDASASGANPERGSESGSESASVSTPSPASMAERAPIGPAPTEGDTGSGASVAGSVPEAELQRAVETTLLQTGVTGQVAADRVTLTGAVPDEQTRDGLEARISVLLGVAAIDNRITIEAPAPAPEPEPIPAGTTLNDLLALEPVTFTSGSPDLTPQGRTVLDQVAAHLIEQPNLNIEIAGHTDDDGAEDANLELSQQRADAVRNHLVAVGVAAERTTAIGHGEVSPLVPNDSLDNKARNRRIEFIVR